MEFGIGVYYKAKCEATPDYNICAVEAFSSLSTLIASRPQVCTSYEAILNCLFSCRSSSGNQMLLHLQTTQGGEVAARKYEEAEAKCKGHADRISEYVPPEGHCMAISDFYKCITNSLDLVAGLDAKEAKSRFIDHFCNILSAYQNQPEPVNKRIIGSLGIHCQGLLGTVHFCSSYKRSPIPLVQYD
ncbi:hypothetical protein M3Y97_01005000 [Aphelenchoides bicaudatus]|nr:hypothetical protein M3Y97_01005000 [Aphelenchoides bicaudatus]